MSEPNEVLVASPELMQAVTNLQVNVPDMDEVCWILFGKKPHELTEEDLKDELPTTNEPAAIEPGVVP